jgi:hypothetical protein
MLESQSEVKCCSYLERKFREYKGVAFFWECYGLAHEE